MPKAAKGAEPKPKPLKRPTQARAKATVQAIFDAYVRIWQRDGSAGVTTRSVALEAGIAIGTLYDYFPNKAALHSGYVRHCIERMIQEVDAAAVQPLDLPWQARVHRAVQIVCGVTDGVSSRFPPDMLALEHQVAEPKHQQRAYVEMTAMWQRVFAACTDIEPPLPAERIESLHLALWGGRRYAMVLGFGAERVRAWAAEMEEVCVGVVLQHLSGKG
jgi:AcrR family transcriptional regulator